jgi:hypothetical protein
MFVQLYKKMIHHVKSNQYYQYYQYYHKLIKTNVHWLNILYCLFNLYLI